MSEKIIIPEISRVNEFRTKDAMQIYAEGIGDGFTDGSSGAYLYQPAGKGEGTAPFDAECPKLPPEESVFIPFDTVFNQVAYTAPSGLVKSGFAVVWVKNKFGISKPYRVNFPRITGQSHLKSVRGGVVRFYGTSMCVSVDYYKGRTDRTMLLCNRETGERHYISNVFDKAYDFNKERYSAEFTLPENIPAGNYTVYIHNGSGGALGWSDPLELEIAEKQTLTEFSADKCFATVNSRRLLPECDTVIVRPDDCGAEKDMADVIQSAIDSLKNGGIVRLTSGIYGVGHTIVVKSGVVLRGAGKANTVIRPCECREFKDDWSEVVFASRKNGLSGWAVDWRSHYEPENPAAVIRLTDNCGIEDLGVEFGNGADIGIMVANINSDVSNGVFVNGVSSDAGYKTAYSAAGDVDAAVCVGLMSVVNTNDLTIFNSDFKAVTPIEILPARNNRLKLIHNLVECSPSHVGESFVCGIFDSLIMGNRFKNGRRSLLMQCGCANNFIFENRSTGVNRATNAQEQYMSEYGDCFWRGISADSGEGYVTIPENEIDIDQTVSQICAEQNLYVCVLDGRGFGQYRRVTGNEGNRVILEKPFDVIPDETTFLTLVTATADNIYLNNDSENGNGPTNIVWGCGLGNTVAGHMVVLSYAMALHGFSAGISRKFPQQNRYGVVAFNTITGCQFKASGMGIRLDSSGPTLKVKDEFYDRFMRHHGIFGTVIRANALEGSKGACYLKNQKSWIEETYNSGMELAGAYNLVTNNYVAGYPNAVKLRYDCEGNYFAKNKFLYAENKFVFEPRHNYYAYFDNRTVGPDADKLWFLD